MDFSFSAVEKAEKGERAVWCFGGLCICGVWCMVWLMWVFLVHVWCS